MAFHRGPGAEGHNRYAMRSTGRDDRLNLFFGAGKDDGIGQVRGKP